jgi:hypothetical protein
VSRWETTSALEADASPAAVWDCAYADAEAWPRWSSEIKRAGLDGPLALGATAKIVLRTGLHLNLVEPGEGGGSRLTNTIYIEGALAPLWGRIMGPAAARALPKAQQAVAELALSPRAPSPG